MTIKFKVFPPSLGRSTFAWIKRRLFLLRSILALADLAGGITRDGISRLLDGMVKQVTPDLFMDHFA